MSQPPTQPPVPYRAWAHWLLRLLLVPIGGAALGMLIALFQFAVTGRIGSVGRNFGPTSSTIEFADNPVAFVFFLALQALVALALVRLTIVLARLAFRRRPQP